MLEQHVSHITPNHHNYVILLQAAKKEKERRKHADRRNGISRCCIAICSRVHARLAMQFQKMLISNARLSETGEPCVRAVYECVSCRCFASVIQRQQLMCRSRFHTFTLEHTFTQLHMPERVQFEVKPVFSAVWAQRWPGTRKNKTIGAVLRWVQLPVLFWLSIGAEVSAFNSLPGLSERCGIGMLRASAMQPSLLC